MPIGLRGMGGMMGGQPARKSRYGVRGDTSRGRTEMGGAVDRFRAGGGMNQQQPQRMAQQNRPKQVRQNARMPKPETNRQRRRGAMRQRPRGGMGIGGAIGGMMG